MNAKQQNAAQRSAQFVNDESAVQFLNYGTSAGAIKGWEQRYYVGRSGPGYEDRPYATKDKQGNVVATFKSAREAHEDVAERHGTMAQEAEAATAHNLAQTHRTIQQENLDKVRELTEKREALPRSPIERRIARMKKEGVTDIPGALADHYYSEDHGFIRDMAGDRTMDLVGGDRGKYRAVMKHLRDNADSDGWKKAADLALKDNPGKATPHSNEIARIANQVRQHVGEAAGDIAHDQWTMFRKGIRLRDL